MINRVVLTGHLTKDPELKTTQSGLSVVQFVIGVQRRFVREDGGREADFISCVAWRKTAEKSHKTLYRRPCGGGHNIKENRTWRNRYGKTQRYEKRHCHLTRFNRYATGILHFPYS